MPSCLNKLWLLDAPRAAGLVQSKQGLPCACIAAAIISFIFSHSESGSRLESARIFLAGTTYSYAALSCAPTPLDCTIQIVTGAKTDIVVNLTAIRVHSVHHCTSIMDNATNLDCTIQIVTGAENQPSRTRRDSGPRHYLLARYPKGKQRSHQHHGKEEYPYSQVDCD